MNITLTSLEALILKATHESLPCPDAAALEAFCAVMKDSSEGVQLAVQALASRVHSCNYKEALLALIMVDRCMRRCDANFHAEVGKFRFLNEMIKLVSPKYYADRTSPEVKTRVLQLLHAWSIEFPKETKFKVAYEMLKNQGVVKETPPPLPPEDPVPPPRSRVKNAIFEDEEKSKLLQKLLQSKKPEDLQHANRLIKTMVKEEERRNEANNRRAQEVGAALDSAGLLRDMLEHAVDASTDEEQLIHELHATCVRLRPVLQRLAASDTQTEYLNDILHASDVLDEVFDKYNAFTKEIKHKVNTGTQAANGESLLDFAGASIKSVNVVKIKDEANKSDVIDELGDIFSVGGDSSTIAEPLKPVSLITNDDIDLLGDTSNKTEAWNDLNSLGEQLMKQSLPENTKRMDGFNGKSTKKIPMNALTSPKHESQPTNNDALFDLDFFTKKPKEEKKISATVLPINPVINDDIMLDIGVGTTANVATNLLNNNFSENKSDKILSLKLENAKSEIDTYLVNKESVTVNEDKKEIKTSKQGDVKSLTDINVTLQSVQPSKVPPVKAFEEEDGISVMLHFCKDKPRPDVNVIVISTTSKNKSPIEDYKFQSVVPKGCKVRLLTPSGSSLPAYNPFLPPPALTQVMLIARPPTVIQIDLKFVITYTCDDEMCSEMGEVAQLPLDDI